MIIVISYYHDFTTIITIGVSQAEPGAGSAWVAPNTRQGPGDSTSLASKEV